MNSKQYDLKLEINASSVIIRCPSGRHWEYDRENLPEVIYELAYRCVQDDAGLCNSIAGSLKVAAAKISMIVLAVLLFSATCYSQDRFQLNTRSVPYVQYSQPYVSPYSTNPPRLYSGRTYLGELSHDRYALDSVSNPYGKYGSQYSPYSINNPYGNYGRYSARPIYVYPRGR